MGTLIQTVFETQAAELRMLGYMGYDVTTFGNHEFDYRSKGLANMLTSARTSGDAVPSIVVCNVDWDAMEPPASLRAAAAQRRLCRLRRAGLHRGAEGRCAHCRGGRFRQGCALLRAHL